MSLVEGFEMALQRNGSGRIRLLARHAPVPEIVKLDRLAADRAAHILSLRNYLIVAIEIAKPGLAPRGKVRFKAIHELSLPFFGSIIQS